MDVKFDKNTLDRYEGSSAVCITAMETPSGILFGCGFTTIYIYFEFYYLYLYYVIARCMKLFKIIDKYDEPF